MDNQIFREKSIKRISSPEELNKYLRVTNPGIWAVLLAVIVLLRQRSMPKQSSATAMCR